MKSLSVIFHVVLFVHICYCGILTSALFDKRDDCERVIQSPIDLPADATIASYGNFNFTGFQYSYETKLVIANGVPEYQLNHSRHILVSGGGLKGTYYFHKMRFLTPTQHTVAGARYFEEAHSIFINTKYTDYETASLYPDGLAVFVTFAMIGTTENLAFKQYIDALGLLDGDPPSFDLPRSYSPISILPKDRCSFFRYRGKYSRDSCREIVTWTIFTDTIELTEKQQIDVLDAYEKISEKFPTGTGHQIIKPRLSDFDSFSYKSRHTVTIQPRIFCKTPLVAKEELPWLLFHKKF